MNNLELYSRLQAEEDAIRGAFERYNLMPRDPNHERTKELPALLQDVLEYPDDVLCEKLEEHIASGADIDETAPRSGIKAVQVCFWEGKMASLRLLLRAGAATKWTPDQVALVLGEVPDHPQTNGTDPFLFACRVGNIDAALSYLTRFDAGRGRDPEAVFEAVRARAPALVRWLMEVGFDPNAQDDGKGCALELAARNDDVETAEALLLAGAAPFGLADKPHLSPVKLATSDRMRRLFVSFGVHPAKFVFGEILENPRLPSLPAHDLSQSDFDLDRTNRAGLSNPERFLPTFWSEQMRTGRYCAPKSLTWKADREKPIWSFVRFGRSATILPDGRLFLVAGEHEDHYDSDFCIYADVTVLHPSGHVDHFIYPEEVFPPTDFHTATLVGDQIWLVGSLGYRKDRREGETQVLRLCTRDYSITPVRTVGAAPGWIHSHCAVLTSNGLLVTGGRAAPDYREKESTYLLDLESLSWEEVPTARTA